jgi:tRNA threonylcarbamoyladenosine biosynthesis protein TsaE
LPILETRTLIWPDEAACQSTAKRLASRPGVRDASIELQGILGAGKTTFARHLLHALGVQGHIKSPTYTLMEPYRLPGQSGDTPAWHFDFYRFDDPREWEDAGFRELYAQRGLKLSEWPDKVAGLLPTSDLRIELEPLDGDRRRVTLHAYTPLGMELLQ